MEPIELHPIFNRYTVYNDHYEGELMNPGDALGRDCMIAAFLPENTKSIDFLLQNAGPVLQYRLRKA